MQSGLLGIEIGGTKLQVVLGDSDGVIAKRSRLSVDPVRGAKGIREGMVSLLREAMAAGAARAIGVGYGGPVNWQDGRIRCSHHVPGWSDFPLGEWLRNLAGLPVRVDNDANVAALGEAHLGAGRGFNPVMYVTLGSGVGGGVTVDGRIYHGGAPGEVEIGHVRLDREGATVESRCAGWSVDRRIREALAAGTRSALAALVSGETRGEARFLAPALAAGDPLARRILDETAGDLAFGLSHAVHLFHPEIIVLGGGLSLVGESLRAAVSLALPGFLMEAFRPGPEIRLANLGEDAVTAGALLLAAGALPA